MQSDATKCRYPIKEAYKLIKDAGFEAIDWNFDDTWDYKALEKIVTGIAYYNAKNYFTF